MRENKTKTKNLDAAKAPEITRRKFVAGTGAAALTFSVAKPGLVLGTRANAKLKLGMIGCGSRGTRVAGHFQNNGNFEVVAGADYFADRVNAWGDKFKIQPNRRFTGLSAYKKLLDSGVDAVAIESPPYFHPGQAEAAVDAGVHVYLAKPIAVDVPGCQLVGESGRKATEKKLCFLVDFQTRANEFYIEALRRVRAGAIGELAFGESSYHAGCPWIRQFPVLKSDPTNPENRLRAWGLDRALSGDIITEQNIHTLDVASWIMDQEPLYAVGTGGRKVRQDFGDCWDHFAMVYQYPNGVGVTFSSRQFEGHGSPGGINNRMFGSKGVLETQYGGQVLIRGQEPYPGGGTGPIFNQGIVQNIATFYENISGSRYENITVAPSVRSNLVTLLGRAAAYRGEQVFWYQLMKDRTCMEPDLVGLKD